MAAIKTQKKPAKPTFETVWAALQETDRIVKENAEQLKDTERLVKDNAAQMAVWRESQKKSQEELDRQMKETSLRMKETDQKIGELGNRFGELAEHLVAPGIAERFNYLGYHFSGVAPGGYQIRNDKGKTIAEIDILLENGNCIMAVEVKSKPKLGDVEHHIRRLEILREHREKRQEKPKKIFGAIAGAIYGDIEKEASIEAGFYVLEQSGDTMKMSVPADFVPREW
jgi:hypothetical protein